MLPTPEPAAHRPRILVVDDDPLVLTAVRRVLAQLEVEVTVHDRAFGLLNRIDELRPTVVLLDVRMPGLDGASLTALIREDPALATTRVVLYSGLDEATLARKARMCGADGYLHKARRPDELLGAVRRWVGTA